jgi:hypothetical protein
MIQAKPSMAQSCLGYLGYPWLMIHIRHVIYELWMHSVAQYLRRLIERNLNERKQLRNGGGDYDILKMKMTISGLEIYDKTVRSYHPTSGLLYVSFVKGEESWERRGPSGTPLAPDPLKQYLPFRKSSRYLLPSQWRIANTKTKHKLFLFDSIFKEPLAVETVTVAYWTLNTIVSVWERWYLDFINVYQ